MLIIDINKQKVHQNPNFDLDVVILKGVSDSLIGSLTQLTTQGILPTAGQPVADAQYTPTPVRRKVALGGCTPKISTTVPSSCKAGGNGAYDQIFAQLSNIINTATGTRRTAVNKAFTDNKLARLALQSDLADVLTKSACFVEALRKAAQASRTLNPNQHMVTTRNIQAAIALYTYYSHDSRFSSAEGSVKANKSAGGMSTDTIARMSNEIGLLRRTGNGSAIRYSVSQPFANLILKTIQTPAFAVLRNNADEIQNQIDALGSL